jgi:hypothetical protein
MNAGSVLNTTPALEQKVNPGFYPTIVSNVINFSEKVHYIMIYNIIGEIILNMTGEFHSLNLSHLKPGIYILLTNNKPEKFIKL